MGWVGLDCLAPQPVQPFMKLLIIQSSICPSKPMRVCGSVQDSPCGSSASTSAGDADSQIVSVDSQDGNSDSPGDGDAAPVKFEEYQFQRLPSVGLLGLTDHPLPMSIGSDLEVTPTDDSKLQWCQHCRFVFLFFFKYPLGATAVVQQVD